MREIVKYMFMIKIIQNEKMNLKTFEVVNRET